MAHRPLIDHAALVSEALFDDPNWLMVEDHEDPESIADRETFGDFVVSYSDLASHDYYQLDQGSIGVITAFPGVTGALHEDRDLILVWGRDVDRTALQVTLTEWWTQNLESN
jgi:hypothetical protein